MIKLTLTEIKKKIDDYVASGGSIYDGRRTLPFYDNLQKFTKRIQQTTDPNFTMVDAYKLCGYDFDREYDDYCKLINILKEFADENGYVDSIKEIDGPNSPKTLLKKMSSLLNCSPSDYLILMTDYRYKKAIISTNYIEQLRKELKSAYPTGDLNNIKRENRSHYDKLRHVCKYGSEIGVNDMQSVAEFFGLTNSRFSDTNIYQHLNFKKILSEIWQVYPNGEIDAFAKDHPSLYYKTTKCAVSQNKTVGQWLEEQGFKYIPSQKTDRFSKTLVDGNIRENELLTIKNNITGNSTPTFNNKRDEYYYKKSIAKLVINNIEHSNTK